MPQIALPSLEAVVVLNPCEAPPPVPVVTTRAPVREHQPLGNNPSIPGVSSTFDGPLVLEGAVYLVRFDNRGQGVLFALDAHNGAECWHTPYP